MRGKRERKGGDKQTKRGDEDQEAKRERGKKKPRERIAEMARLLYRNQKLEEGK